jgi:hypothetical protein
MKNVNSTFMKAHTFIGPGTEGACLFIEPTFEQPGFKNGDDLYEHDAIALANFLESVFCTATLQVLKRML